MQQTKFETLQDLENFYDAMMPAQEKSHASFAWFSGLPHPLFNAVMHLKTPNNVADKVESLMAKLPCSTPLSFWIHDQNESIGLIDILKKQGFQLLITCPLMTWPVKSLSVLKAEIVLANPETFYPLLAANFHLDESVTEGFAKLLKNVEAENYLIYHKGQPVSTGTLILHNKIGGIFNISTLPEYQKQGFGRAMMHFLMNRAALLHLEQLVLLSSPVAKKLYSDLAFIKCFDIKIYAR